PRSAYRTTRYRFPSQNGEEFIHETSLFGTALIRFLRQNGTQIDRWIVLGTSASLWSELNQVLPNPDVVLDQHCQIDDLVSARRVDATALQTWQNTLNSHSVDLEMRLCLTGEALAAKSQQQIAQALFENIPQGNDVVFDISHGFRHQPVIATFIISLMRWTHRIQRVRFYSGVFEARQGDVTPVLELPICQQLVEATEAAAILDVTGNYEPVARFLGQNAELAWFLENTNQLGNARTQAQQLRQVTTNHATGIEAQLATLFHDRLEWSTHNRFTERVLQSAQTAIEHGDYFRAVILTYEAILIRAGHTFSPTADPLNYETREQAEQELFRHLTGSDRDLLTDLQHTRNACAHGTRSDRASVQRILRNPQEFRNLVCRACDLFDRLPQLLAS
ncbi:MAG: TIGR02221 family CRISPR-associated protein, partial [Gemmataceae bacterium]|nr:TIGR02221 family CRISPR-associated protein [Gemmataceae bacterium]